MICALQQLFCKIRTNLVSVEVTTGGSPHRDKVARGSSLPVWSELRLIYIGWSWFMMYELKPNRSGFVLSVVQMLAAYFLLFIFFFCRTLICWKGHCSDGFQRSKEPVRAALLLEGIELKGPNYLLQQVPLHHLECKVRVLLQTSSNLREVLLMVQNKITLPFLQTRKCSLAL